MKIFTKALVRRPGKEIINALSITPTTRPDYELALQQHDNYIQALSKAGVNAIICDADERFPDGCFTEDTHLILPEVIIRLNPGAISRRGEPESLQAYLPQDRPHHLLDQACLIDGGDIQVADKRIYVGLSSRTLAQSAMALAALVMPYGYSVVTVQVPEGLHLKSGMTCLDAHTFILQKHFEEILKKIHGSLGEKKDYFVVPENEQEAANILPLNGFVIMPPQCDVTRKFIAQFIPAQNVLEVDTSEFRKVDGALTCLSIPW